MSAERDVDYILDDCFFAVGQAVGTQKSIDYDAVVWWRTRYREFFLRAVTVGGNSWSEDRQRVIAVGRYLGSRALHHAAGKPSIDVESAAKASAEVETGCQMRRLQSTA